MDMEGYDKETWYKSVLENIPKGEEGHLQLNIDEASDLLKILLKNDYAVMVTNSDLEGKVRISWIFYYPELGSDVCFTSTDYIIDYPDAVLFEQQKNSKKEE